MADERSTSFPIRSWKDWWDNQQGSGNDRILLLDVRSAAEYDERKLDPFHLPEHQHQEQPLNVVHIPISVLKDRLFELPPRQVPFAILIHLKDDPSACLHQLELALSHRTFNGKGQQKKRSASNQRLVCPHKITAVIDASKEETWNEAAACGLGILVGKHTTTTQTFRPEPRLWQPDPLVQNILLPLLKKEMIQRTAKETYHVWDLGSGVGRDVVFLAEELLKESKPSFRVVGLDQRYRNLHHNETLEFWKRRHCEDVTQCKCLDLNNADAMRTELLAVEAGAATYTPVKCFFAVRYWNRPLFDQIVRLGCERKLAQGTLVAISQFGKPSADATWDFPHPKVCTRNNIVLAPEQTCNESFSPFSCACRRSMYFDGMNWRSSSYQRKQIRSRRSGKFCTMKLRRTAIMVGH